MLPIAGQTAGPNELTFLWTLRGGRGVLKAKKSKYFFKIIKTKFCSKFFFQIYFFFI